MQYQVLLLFNYHEQRNAAYRASLNYHVILYRIVIILYAIIILPNRGRMSF